MSSLRNYLAGQNANNSFVIGVPGFVAFEETTRLDRLLQKIATEHNTNCSRLTYSDIHYEPWRNELRAEFNLERCVQDLRDSVIFLTSQSQSPNPKISFVASSIGAAITTRYLLSYEDQRPASFAAISPLLGWPYFASESTRLQLQKNKHNIPILQNGGTIRRYIPREQLPSLMEVDTLKELEEKGNIPNVSVLTVIGIRDEISNPQAMRRFHELLGGSKENLHEYDAGHDIPSDLYEQPLISFLTSSISGYNSTNPLAA